ncbi:MAG TPA: hypothetical protein VGN86_04355 [Pyrinomonadaceae bacterium]|nr:hypothetical protein [Pyrinomonadaceae bacterium]
MRWLINPSVMALTFLIGASVVGFGHREVVSLAIPQVVKPVATDKSQADLEAEKYAVLSAVIKDMYLQGGTTQMVIEHEATCPAPGLSKEVSEEGSPASESEKDAITALPELKSETMNDFHANKRKCRQLARKFDIPVPYVLVTDKDTDRFFGQDNLRLGWQTFYAKFKGSPGITTFSNVGFDDAMTQALLTTGNTCGGLCGAGYFVLLEKKDGVWFVKNKIVTWIS